MSEKKIVRPSASSLDGQGREIPDGRPLEAPLPLRLPRSTVDLIRDMVRREMSAAAEQQGFESFEDADDFEVDDDPEMERTPYERVFDPPGTDDPVLAGLLEKAGLKLPADPEVQPPEKKDAPTVTSGPSDPPLDKPKA